MKLRLSILFVVVLLVALAFPQSTGVMWTIPATSVTACGISDSTTALSAFCPTKVGLFYTSDGGHNWQGPLLSSVPAPPPVTFPSISGSLSPTQLPSNFTCAYTGVVNATGGTITLNSCH